MNNSTSSICLLNNTGIDVFVWQIGVLDIPGHLITMLNSNRQRSRPTDLYFISSESTYLLFLFSNSLDIVNLVPQSRILESALFYLLVSGVGFISLILLAQLNLDRIFFIFHYCFSLHYDTKAFIIFDQSCCVYKHYSI
jgi:hypothetical protein